MSKPLKTNPHNTAEPAKSPFWRALDKVRYELPVFLFFLVFYPPQHLAVTYDIYCALHVFDYRIGFAPRLFIGSLMSLFTDYKSEAFMDTFYIVVFLMEALLFAFIAGRIIRGADKDTKDIAVIFVLFFLAVPYSLATLYPRLLSLDRFMVLYTLLSLILITKKGFKWFVPLLLAIGLATYTGFAFTYMPAVAIVLLYETYKEKPSVGGKILFVLSFAVMAVFSAYFFLFDGLNRYSNVEELVAWATGKTDLISVEYFRTVVETLLLITPSDFFWDATVPLEGYKGFVHEFTSTIFLLPLYTTFFVIWRNSIKSSKDKFEKFIFTLCLLAPIARFPMFILSTNFFRGRISVVVVQFFLIFYFIHNKNKTVTNSMKKVGGFFADHSLLLLLMIAYFALPFLTLQTGEFWSKILGDVVNRF